MANGFLPQETPQEILARLSAGRTQQAGSDPQLGRLANQENALDVLFGNPEAERAKRLQDATQAVNKTFKPNPNASELDNEMARLRIMRDEIQEIDPGTAEQISTRLLELEVTSEERRRLKGLESRQETAESRAASEDRAEQVGRQFKVIIDPVTGETLGQVNTETGEGMEQFAALRASNPNVVLQDQDDFIADTVQLKRDRLALQRAQAKARAGRDPATGAQKRINALSDLAGGNFDFALGTERLLDLVEQDPQTFGVGGTVASGLGKLAAHGRSFFATLQGGEQAQDQMLSRVDNALDQANIRSSQKRALVQDLAFAIATTRESGRLTDQDIERAIITLGGDNPDPRALSAVLIDLYERRSTRWDSELKLKGLTRVNDAQEIWQEVENRYDILDERVARMKEQFGLTSEQASEFAKTGLIEALGEADITLTQPPAEAAPTTVPGITSIRRVGG